MLCEQVGIRLTKDEMKLNIRSFLRTVCSRLMGDFNGFTSMREEHIPRPVENAKQKVGETSETERYEDMVGGDQDGRLIVHATKQYPTEDTTCFHVLGRGMSGTQRGGQEVRLLGENYTGCDEEGNRNMRVGRPWVNEARYKVEVNRVPAGNWVMIEGIDQPIVKTSNINDMQGKEGLHIFRPLLYGGSVFDSPRKLFTMGSKMDTDRVCVEWHMKQSRHSITVSQDGYIKKVVFKN